MTFEQLRIAMAIFSTPAIEAEMDAVNVSHDTLHMIGPLPDDLLDNELKALGDAGWHWDEEFESWIHYV